MRHRAGTRRGVWMAAMVSLCGVVLSARADVDVVELSIRDAQDGLRSGRLTSRQLAEASLARIARYNPAYNAIITPNPQALADADSIDRRRAAGETLGPLAGIPAVVKDTIDMAGLPTTAGWAPLSARAGGTDLLPQYDAPVVERLRAAGVVILGKTNVPVLSLSFDNANDSWAGPTLNAAAPLRAPGGSSAGSATAVAASFALFGLAEETGGSIQCPAAYQGLVGIKPSFGLVPNTGVVPLGTSSRDVIGPIARTVADAAIVLDVLAGYTAGDPKTVAAIAQVPAQGYAAALGTATLNGKRIGTYGPGWLADPLASETQQLYERALAVIGTRGGVLVRDPFAGSGFAELARPLRAWKYDPRGEESVAYDLQAYLARLGPKAAARSLPELVALTGIDPFSATGPLEYERDQPAFVASLADPSRPPDMSGFLVAREQYIAVLSAVFDRHDLDAMVLPQLLDEPPLLRSDKSAGPTTVSQINIGGFPGITVPAGYYASGTPFSVIVVGRLWDEARLLAIAHAFEQATRARRVPELVERPKSS